MTPLPQAPSGLGREEFLSRYGAVCENTAWIAEQVFDTGLTPAQDSVEGLARAFMAIIASAPRARQLAYIQAHPELAGRAAASGDMTAESTTEQASAGLDRCSEAELAQLTTLNQAYRDKFGFPFIMAVRGSTRQEILAAFARRLERDRETEFKQALSEIGKILNLRLHAIAGGQT